jgi:uncharacterized protein (TIGR02996 family)
MGQTLSATLVTAVPDAEHFLDMIREHPDDDGPRLVFADWLEEHGDTARAEFIRVQCEAAGLPRHHPRRELLRQRAAVLREAHGRAWFPETADWNHGRDFALRRGFLDMVRLDRERVVAKVEACLRRWPVTELQISDVGADVTMQAIQAPWLARLRTIETHRAGLTAKELVRLGANPAVAGLRCLRIGENSLGDAGAVAVAGGPSLAGLLELDMRHNHLGSAGVRALAASPTLTALRSLNLCGNTHSIDDVIGLLESPRLPALTELSLWNTQLHDGAVEKLARCPGLARLRALDLNNNPITGAALAALAKSPHAATLQTLSLAYNRFTPAAVRPLLVSACLPALAEVNLYQNGSIEGTAADALRREFGPRIVFRDPWDRDV